MDIQLIKASEEHKSVVRNLMQFYIYDFSEYVKCDVEEDGLFEAYAGLEEYWGNENHKFSYIIKKDEKYVGFVLVKYIESKQRNYFSIAEFFVMRKYRREGVGRTIAVRVFDLHRGQWEVYQKESNKPAQVFWNTIIDEYTQGKFKERFEDGKRIQDFES